MDSLELLESKLKKANNAHDGATDGMKLIYKKQIDKLEEQIASAKKALEAAPTPAAEEVVIEKVEKQAKKAEKVIKETKQVDQKLKGALIQFTKRSKELGSFIKDQEAKLKKKFGNTMDDQIKKIKDYFNDTFVFDTKTKSLEELKKATDLAISYKKEAGELFDKMEKEAPDEKCAELIEQYENRRKAKQKQAADERSEAKKAKDKASNYAESILKSVEKLVEKGDITGKGIDVIINRLMDLLTSLKALKKKSK